MPKRRNYLQLHFIVFLGSLIPIIAIWITIPSVEIVFYRTLMAIVILSLVIVLRKESFKIDRTSLFKLILTGILTFVFWALIIVSAKTSNASVCLVGLATNPLWVSFLNPLFMKKRIKAYQVLLAAVTTIGVYIIMSHNFSYEGGLYIAILAAFFGALLTIINSRLAIYHSHYVITFYQMVGAWIGSVICLPFYLNFFVDKSTNLYPNITDLVLILSLAVVFSVYAYSVFIKIMKDLTPFTVSLTSNLSTIYGILAALLFFGQNEKMNPYFYLGTTLIVLSVIALPLLIHYKTISQSKKEEAYEL